MWATSMYRGKFYSVTYPASTDIIAIITQTHSLYEKVTTTVKSPIGQFPLNYPLMLLVSHFNLSTLFQTHSQYLKKTSNKSLIGWLCMLFIYH